MMDQQPTPTGAAELEEIWSGAFGDAYVDRNAAAIPARAAFWRGLIEQFPSTRVLEVGCAHGENLAHLADTLDAHHLWGLDINDRALLELKTRVPTVNAAWGPARELPFRDRYFDLVFTVGLLIHQPDDTLPIVMNEIVRCSKRWVACGEYHADEPTTIEYRGRSGLLFKRDYGALYPALIPGLTLRYSQELTQDEHGFDRVSFHLFERTD